jgi:hypothetical protein
LGKVPFLEFRKQQTQRFGFEVFSGESTPPQKSRKKTLYADFQKKTRLRRASLITDFQKKNRLRRASLYTDFQKKTRLRRASLYTDFKEKPACGGLLYTQTSRKKPACGGLLYTQTSRPRRQTGFGSFKKPLMRICADMMTDGRRSPSDSALGICVELKKRNDDGSLGVVIRKSFRRILWGRTEAGNAIFRPKHLLPCTTVP